MEADGVLSQGFEIKPSEKFSEFALKKRLILGAADASLLMPANGLGLWPIR